MYNFISSLVIVMKHINQLKLQLYFTLHCNDIEHRSYNALQLFLYSFAFSVKYVDTISFRITES